MKNNYPSLLALLCLWVWGLGSYATTAPAAKFLLPNGRLSTAAIGNQQLSLDLKGWHVSLDPKVGPVFSLAPPPADGLSALDKGLINTVNALAFSGSNVYVRGSFTAVGAGGTTLPDLNRIAKWGAVTASNPFVTTWKTDNPGTSSNTSITIPTESGSVYNYDVDWNNDGTFDDLGLTGNATHDYGTAGNYSVAIRGTFPSIYFNNAGDKEKFLSIEQWGDIVWTNMGSAFRGCENMILNATDVPNTAAVTDMSNMFEGCRAFNQPLPAGFNTSAVTDMSYMFSE